MNGMEVVLDKVEPIFLDKPKEYPILETHPGLYMQPLFEKMDFPYKHNVPEETRGIYIDQYI